MTARTMPAQRDDGARERLDMLGFVARSVAPSEVRMSRRGSWVPLDFAGLLQRLEVDSERGISPV